MTLVFFFFFLFHVFKRLIFAFEGGFPFRLGLLHFLSQPATRLLIPVASVLLSPLACPYILLYFEQPGFRLGLILPRRAWKQFWSRSSI